MGVQVIKLDGNQFGDFRRDHLHGIFSSAQAASGGEHRADIEESVIRRVVHDWNELITHQQYRKLFVGDARSEEHTSELQSLMRISYAVFCLNKKNKQQCQ